MCVCEFPYTSVLDESIIEHIDCWALVEILVGSHVVWNHHVAGVSLSEESFARL